MGIRKVNRDILIEKAAHFFRTQGYHGTSMQTIAEALNINKASLYHHILDKETLALTVLQTIRQFFQTRFFAIAYQDPPPARERLQDMMSQLESYFLHCEGGCLMANFTLELGPQFPRFSEVILAYLQDWIGVLSHLLKTCYPVEQAQDLAEQAMARFQGALIQHRLGEIAPLLKQKNYLLQTFDQGFLLSADYFRSDETSLLAEGS